jgi:hypothetical protein
MCVKKQRCVQEHSNLTAAQCIHAKKNVHARKHTHVHTYIHIYERKRCVKGLEFDLSFEVDPDGICKHTYIQTYIHTHTHMDTSFSKLCVHTYTHIHTYTHTHMDTSFRKRCVEELQFDRNLEFDSGDVGPSGGVQVLESAFVRAHPKYVPDRIIRSAGAALTTDPWPKEKESSKENNKSEPNNTVQIAA